MAVRSPRTLRTGIALVLGAGVALAYAMSFGGARSSPVCATADANGHIVDDGCDADGRCLKCIVRER